MWLGALNSVVGCSGEGCVTWSDPFCEASSGSFTEPSVLDTALLGWVIVEILWVDAIESPRSCRVTPEPTGFLPGVSRLSGASPTLEGSWDGSWEGSAVSFRAAPAAAITSSTCFEGVTGWEPSGC